MLGSLPVQDLLNVGGPLHVIILFVMHLTRIMEETLVLHTHTEQEPRLDLSHMIAHTIACNKHNMLHHLVQDNANLTHAELQLVDIRPAFLTTCRVPRTTARNKHVLWCGRNITNSYRNNSSWHTLRITTTYTCAEW